MIQIIYCSEPELEDSARLWTFWAEEGGRILKFSVPMGASEEELREYIKAVEERFALPPD